MRAKHHRLFTPIRELYRGRLVPTLGLIHLHHDPKSLLHHVHTFPNLLFEIGAVRCRLSPSLAAKRRQLITPRPSLQHTPDLQVNRITLWVRLKIQRPWCARVNTVNHTVRLLVTEQRVRSLDSVIIHAEEHCIPGTRAPGVTEEMLALFEDHERRAHFLAFQPQDDGFLTAFEKVYRARAPTALPALDLNQRSKALLEDIHTAKELAVNLIVVNRCLLPPFGVQRAELRAPSERPQGGPLLEVQCVLRRV